MQQERTIDVCDNCGYETLDTTEVEATTVRLPDGKYKLDLCHPNGCFNLLAELAHKGMLVHTGIEAEAEIVDLEPAAASPNGVGPTTCAACERTFASEAGLRVHISRMHA